MSQTGGSYTRPQRRVLGLLLANGAMGAAALAESVPTSLSGLSIICQHLWPIVRWQYDAEVYYIAREHLDEAEGNAVYVA